jgi:hypothetical protein
MPTSNLTKTLTIEPSYRKGTRGVGTGPITLFNLKPIRRRIAQVIGTFPIKDTNIIITIRTKKTDAITFDITITVQGPPRPPDDKPPHPPRKEIIL